MLTLRIYRDNIGSISGNDLTQCEEHTVKMISKKRPRIMKIIIGLLNEHS